MNVSKKTDSLEKRLMDKSIKLVLSSIAIAKNKGYDKHIILGGIFSAAFIGTNIGARSHRLEEFMDRIENAWKTCPTKEKTK